MRQYFTGKELINASRLFERHLFGVAQLGIGLVLHDEAIFVYGFKIGTIVARLETFASLQFYAFSNDRRCAFITPTNSLVNRLLFGRTKLLAVCLHRRLKTSAELVVVVEHAFTDFLLRQSGQFENRIITLPSRRIEQLLSPLLWNHLLGRLSVLVVHVVCVFFVFTPEPCLNLGLDCAELLVEIVTKLGINLSSKGLVTAGKAQGFDGAAL
ncbi:hypothetical protein D3C86_1326810 [compost metagenome]